MARWGSRSHIWTICDIKRTRRTRFAHSVRQRTVNVCIGGVQAANWVTHCNFSWLRLCHALTHSELQHMTDRTF